MKLNDKMPLWAKRKSDIPRVTNEEIIKNIKENSTKKTEDSDNTDNTDKRIYPPLGDSYAKPTKVLIARLILSAILLIVSVVWDFPGTTILGIRLAAFLVAGYDIFIRAVQDIKKREYLRENLFVTVAAIISFLIRREIEAVLAPIILQTAYIFRDYVIYRTRETIVEFIEPVLSQNSQKSSSILPGDKITIDTGMTIPVDSVIIEGTGYVDLSFITGETSFKSMSKDEFLPAGSKCVEGQFVVEAKTVPESSLFKQISNVLKSGFSIMTETEGIWYSLTKLFVLISLGLSVLLLLILPLIFELSLFEAFRRVVTIIAILSPAGLLIGIPICFFAGIAAARKKGVAIRSSRVLEKAASIKVVVFNKVGTLTEKNYLVTDIKTDKMDPATFLKVAAYAEANSDSDVAKAIVSAYGGEISEELVQNFVEYPGKGVSVSVDDIQIVLGSGEFMVEKDVSIPDGSYEGNIVHMAVNGIYAGRISLSESVTQDASDTVHLLSSLGVERIAMVSGDARERDRAIANELSIEEYYAECTPEEKVFRIKSIKDRLNSRSNLAFIGNPDSPKQGFDAADVGVLINGISLYSNFPQTDVVILNNANYPFISVINAAQITKKYIHIGAIGYCIIKVLIMLLASFGFAPLWFGMIIDGCLSSAFVVNCMRPINRNLNQNKYS